MDRIFYGIPDVLGAARSRYAGKRTLVVLVTLGDKVIEDGKLAKHPIAFEAKAALMDQRIPAIRVEWTLSSKEVAMPVFVRASSDGGLSWTSFNVPHRARRIEIDPAPLPPGDACVVEVLVGERLRTTTWRSESIPVRTGRDGLFVLAPREDTKVHYGEPVEFAATTTYGAGYDEIIWSSDRDGDIGSGGQLLAKLSPGRHVISVRRGACGKPQRGRVVQVVGPAASRKSKKG